MNVADMPCKDCEAPLAREHRFCPVCGAAVDAPPPAHDPLQAAVGQALGEAYRIVRLLGRGGMGAVYLARDRALDRLVAIKVLPPDESGPAESRERFLREARTAASLSHPNIVPLHSFGEADGMLYFVMGYVPGESLRERMRRETPLAVEEARKILADVADALDYAHRQGVVHRDVKPENVLLEDESGRALLTDFGVAKGYGTYQPGVSSLGADSTFGLAGHLTTAGEIVGTPNYMSPEQASGEGIIDGRSDLYSLGVMGYEMLSGRRPFTGHTVADALANRLTQDAPPLEAVAPNVEEALAKTLTRCLVRSPVFRWQDARSLREALVSKRVVEELVPESLPMLGGSALETVLKSAACSLLLAGFWDALPGGPDMTLATLAFFLPVSAFFLALRFARMEKALGNKGYSRRELLRALFWPPKWWRWWYPRRLRPPGDLWDLLAPEVRAARHRSWWVLGACVSLFLVLGPAAASLSFGFGAVAIVGLIGAGLAVPGVLSQRYQRWVADHGLDWVDERRMLYEPTTRRAFWKEPHIARLLAPATPLQGSASLAGPRSPQEYLQAIVRAAEGLAGLLRPVGDEAVSAARRLISCLESMDREIARLARDAEPGEASRIAARLEALAVDAPAPAPASDQVRVLSKQRDLILGLEGTIDSAARHRARLLDLLKTLWLQLAHLRAQDARERESSASSQISGHVRALCAEIEQLAGVFGPSEPADASTLTR